MQTEPIPARPDVEVIDKQPLADVEITLIPEAPVTTRIPSDLADLSAATHIDIQRRLRIKSVLLLKGKKNLFALKTSDGKILYTVKEENEWWGSYFCFGLRPLQLRVYNNQGKEVMIINRPYACTLRPFPCALQRLQVYLPPGILLGRIEQQYCPVRPLYSIKDVNGKDLFSIRGPRLTMNCCWDVRFAISRPDGTPVGFTNKEWQGLLHAVLLAPVVDNFSVTFDAPLSVEEKALLLAATLLINYMYYDT